MTTLHTLKKQSKNDVASAFKAILDQLAIDPSFGPLSFALSQRYILKSQNAEKPRDSIDLFRKSRNDVAMLYPCPKALPPLQ